MTQAEPSLYSVIACCGTIVLIVALCFIGSVFPLGVLALLFL